RKYLPCPSEVARPLSDINQWDGNVPFKGGKINDKAPMFEGKTIFHDPFSRHVEVVAPAEVVPPDQNCEQCRGRGEMDSGGVTPWDAPILVRCDCTYPPPRKKSLIQKIREYLDTL